MGTRLLTAIMTICLFSAYSFSAQIRYRAIDLGTLGGSESHACSINNKNQIVGESWDWMNRPRATLFDPNGEPLDLGTIEGAADSSARSININGDVAGDSGGYAARFLSGFENYALTDWQTVPGGYSTAVKIPGIAWSISDSPPGSQLIAGTKLYPQSLRRAFFFMMMPNIGPYSQELGTLGGNSSDAYYIQTYPERELIRVVGSAETSSGQIHACLFGSVMRDGNNIDLGTLGGTFSEAFCINASDQVVGWSYDGFSDYTCHAAIFDPCGTGFNTGLGTLGDSSSYSAALAINNRGQVVGWSDTSDSYWGSHAVLFDPTGSGHNIDLNTVIDHNCPLELYHAYSINDNGWIVGDAVTQDYRFHAFLLVPLPQPCQYMLDGDINNDCKADFFDFALLANRWFDSCQDPNWCSHADTDRSGRVDFADLLSIGRNWLTDCDCWPISPDCKQITAFDYAVISNGPLSMSAAASIEGLRDNNEANVYINSYNSSSYTLSMTGFTSIAGLVDFADMYATINIDSNASIGGKKGADANSNVRFLSMPVKVPQPDTAVFEPYATNIVDADTDVTSGTFKNIRILADTNPCFGGECQFNGVILIEQPNVVTFTGNISIEGFIVAINPDPNFYPPPSAIIFAGGLNMTAPTDRTEYGGLVDLKGTAILAPGFFIDFGSGNPSFTVHGTIAASGIDVSSTPGGTIRGSLIDYSYEGISICGSAKLIFDHSNLPPHPAGFK